VVERQLPKLNVVGSIPIARSNPGRPMGHIKESDWTLFRRLRAVALQRFCERALAEMARVNADVRKTHHDRYGEIRRVLEERDRELAAAFNADRRSTAIQQLALIRSHDLLTDDEFSQFSDETRERIEGMLAFRNGR
jgi:hypothetical protein